MRAAGVAHRKTGFLRFALLVMLCVMAGVGATIAIAWGLAAFLPHRNLERAETSSATLWNGPRDNSRPIEIDDYSRAGMARRAWARYSYGDLTMPSALSFAFSARAVTVKRATDLSWGRLPAVLAGADDPRRHGMEDARGWPRLALWCGLEQTWPDAGFSAAGGIRLSDATATAGDFRALPCRPIWSGLLVDSALYSAVWGVLAVFVERRPIRRWRRRRRGQCPICGYSLAGLAPGAACPECGSGTERGQGRT